MKKLYEILAGAGVEQEVIDKVKGELAKEDLALVKPSEYEKKSKSEALEVELKELKTENADLIKLRDSSKETSVKLDTVTAELNQAKLDKENAERDLRVNFELEKKLLADKVPPISGGYKSYVDQIDKGKVTYKDGKVEGVDEAYEAFKTGNEALFNALGTTTVEGHKNPPAPGGEQKNKLPTTMEEWVTLKNNNSAMYTQMWPNRNKLAAQQAQASSAQQSS